MSSSRQRNPEVLRTNCFDFTLAGSGSQLWGTRFKISPHNHFLVLHTGDTEEDETETIIPTKQAERLFPKHIKPVSSEPPLTTI